MIPTEKQRQQIRDLASSFELSTVHCDEKFKRHPDEVNKDVAELLDLAEYFNKSGKPMNAEFMRKTARRLQYLEG